MKLFLSYGHDDNERLVLRIKADLEKEENGGHDCWLDKSEIKFGDDWRRSIADGISDSKWVLSFISRHACREGGVCLDELSIAAHKANAITPILVESLDKPDALFLPLTVSHIQYLDMQEWTSEPFESKGFNEWYELRFKEILWILTNPDTERFAGEIETLRNDLDPLDNAARIGELSQNGFIGRDWIFEEIKDWLENKPDQKVYCLTGEPGFGKSAVAARIASGHLDGVVAAHFCQYNQNRFSDPRLVIKSIAFQIASRLPDFRKNLINNINRLKSSGDPLKPSQLETLSPEELFTELIANPSACTIAGGRKRHLIIIDALDESGEVLAEFLAQHQNQLPRWLALFITSRPDDPGFKQHLSMLNPHRQEISDPRNEVDARKWMDVWFNTVKVLSDKSNISDKLWIASDGNFNYLTIFRKMVEEGSMSIENPDEYPQGLDSLYLANFRRQFKDDEKYGTWQAPLLSLMVAARIPLPLDLAQKILDVSDDRDWNIKVIQPLGSLFIKDNDTLKPFHKSMIDWLVNSDKSDRFYVSAVDGNRKLAMSLTTRDYSSEYYFSETPYHIDQLNNKGLCELIPNFDSRNILRKQMIYIWELMTEQGKYKNAESWARSLVRLDERKDGDKSPNLAESYNNLGKTQLYTGRSDDAIQSFQKNTEICKKVYGTKSNEVAFSYLNTAEAYKQASNFNEAIRFGILAVGITENLGADDTYLALEYSSLATSYRHSKDNGNALKFFLAAKSCFEKSPDDSNKAIFYNNFSSLYRDLGDTDNLIKYLLLAKKVRIEVCGIESLATAETYVNLIPAYCTKQNFEEAIRYGILAKNIMEHLDADERVLSRAYANLGFAFLEAKKNYIEAEKYLLKAKEISEKYVGSEEPETTIIYSNLAHLYNDKKQYANAIKFCELAINGHRQKHGDSFHKTIQNENFLKVLKKNARR